MTTNADVNAPVHATAERTVHASPQEVWAVISDIARWPEWNPDVQSAELDGPLTPGTVFRWQAGKARITSRLEEVAPPTTIAWSGKLPGVSAIHVWRIERRGDTTQVITEESWNGLVPRLFRKRSRAMLDSAIASGLDAIKRESERRSGTASGPAPPYPR